jgi:hypothetical protein
MLVYDKRYNLGSYTFKMKPEHETQQVINNEFILWLINRMTVNKYSLKILIT